MLAVKRGMLSLLVLIVLIPLVSISAQDSGEGQSGLRPDAPPYGIRGAHAVGTRDLTIDDETLLDITVWYPALNADNLDEGITYPYVIKMDAPLGAVATVTGQALADAAYDLSAAPYPLVILSPGFSLGRTAYAWLAEHLASYGFVVIAPEHHEQLDSTFSGFWRATITRPQEVVKVLDYADAQVSTGGTFEGLIDTDQTAVIGHSYGGYTALAIAGGQFDIDSFAARCETASATGDPAAWLCDLILPYVSDMAELVGLDAVPTGLWSGWADSRVDAIVPMAGDAYIFDEAGLAEVTVPVLAMGGTDDTGTPYLWGTQPTYHYVSSETKAIVGFENAEHMIFGSTCEALPWFVEIGFYQICSDAVWDMDRAHDLISHFTTAFLLAELKQNVDAAAALAPDAVTFPGVTYEAQGF